MQNIYEHRSSNIAKTWVLYSMFLVLVIGTGWVFAQIYREQAIFFFAVALSSGMSIVSYWFSDKIALGMARAKPVELRDAPDLYRIVENLSITAGLPTPKIYIIEEDAPNAFATGRNPKHAVVAVTRGLLNRLEKSELEGVIAHELAHIGNRDMLLQTSVVVLVGVVSILADFFVRSSMWGGRRNDSDGGRGGNILMLVGIVLAILTPILARLMMLAISRKREFLADASGALLTRYPEGLANALLKISSYSGQMRVAQNTTAHLWIDDPFKGKEKASFWHTLFLTHPPVEARVRALREMAL